MTEEAISSGIYRFILKEGLVIVLALIGIFFLIALSTHNKNDPGWTYTGNGEAINNYAGMVGAWLADVFFNLFGYLAFVLPILLFIQAYRTFKKELDFQQPDYLILGVRFLSWFFVFSSACGLFATHLLSPNDLPSGSGGILGTEIARLSVSAFSVFGGSLILFVLFLLAFSFAANISWFVVVEQVGILSIRLYERIRTLIESRLRTRTKKY
jgi:S-DNA-T family DNA segregation ATPase FtsK/SpoIIIE